MNKEQLVKRRKARFTLVFMVLIFIMPLLFAYTCTKLPDFWPSSTKNFGTLYKPAVQLKDFNLYTEQGEIFSLEQLRGKWSLIYIGGSNCAQICRETLYKAGAARIAQGVDAGRVEYYYLLAADNSLDDMQSLEKDHPRMKILRGNAAQRESLISQFAIQPGHKPGEDDRLYLVDPNGNVIMYYPAGFRDIWLMEDLKHLLKWSQIG